MNESSAENTTIYIGGLASNVSEKTLLDIFLKFGKIVKLRIARDNFNKRPLGHGYIVFQRRCDAERAMDCVNLNKIMGQPCKIKWYEKEIMKSKFWAGNIIIKNLDVATSERDICEAFETFGTITSCKFNYDENGVFIGSTFVNYQNEKDAERAVEFMNETLFKNKTIIVEHYAIKDRLSKIQSVDCYVDNFPLSLNDEALRNMFEKYGSVVTAKLILNDDGIPKGCGIVCFKEFHDAAIATAELNGHEVHNKIIRVYQVSLKKCLLSGCNLYVRNLSDKMSDERLKQLFQVFGQIFSVKVVTYPVTNKPVGYGFVAFVNTEDGENAMREMNGKIVDGRSLFVAVKKTDNCYDDQSPANICHSPKSLSLESVQPCTKTHLPAPPMCINQPKNFVRMPNPMVKEFPVPISDNDRVKEILADKLSSLVKKYHGDKASFITNKLMELISMTELFQMLDNESVLRMRAQDIAETMIVDPHTINEKLEAHQSNNKVAMIDSPPDLTSSSEYSCDDEGEKNVKYSLCRKIYISVRNMVGDSAAEIIKRFNRLSKTELFYMLEHEDYLRNKVEVAKNELKVIECMTSQARLVNGSSSIISGDDRTIKCSGNIQLDTETQTMATKIYIMVSKYAGKLAGSITDSFLNLDPSELQYMIDNEEYVRIKVDMTMSQMIPVSNNSYNESTTNVNDTLKDDTLVSEIQEAMRVMDMKKRMGHTSMNRGGLMARFKCSNKQ